MSLGNILPMMGDKETSAQSTPAFAGITSRRGETRTDETIKEVMHCRGQGKLHAGPGGKHLAESQDRALAIAYNIAEDSEKADGAQKVGRR